MLLNKELFDSIAPYKLLAVHASVCLTTCVIQMMGDSQCMLNVLLPGTKYDILRHTDTSELVVCIYGKIIECFYDEQGNEMEMVAMKVGRGEYTWM